MSTIVLNAGKAPLSNGLKRGRCFFQAVADECSRLDSEIVKEALKEGGGEGARKL